MRPDLWPQIDELFERALAHAPERRDRFVAEIEDAEIRAAVERLLAADAAAGTEFLDPSKRFGNGADSPVPGDVVGAYRLLRSIGRGATSRVFLATRIDEDEGRQVAIKLLRHDVAQPELHARMKAERVILGRLEHPNIARLYDSGHTRDGLPYLVMEYVDGEPIDRYCAGKPVEVILGLLCAVCSAVAFAHRNLLIHRDLKPNNILVAHDGQPKLLDFGIARPIVRAAGDLESTLTGLRPMTPAYASPEQFRGDPLTSTSDVYSLGVVLYRLLSGSMPERPSAAYGVRDNEVPVDGSPRPPSLVVARNDPALSRQLRGDLDTIALKALAIDPNQRYPTAAELGADLNRYRQARPIQARPPTLGYRLGRFLRRNRRFASATFALIALALVTAFWIGRQRHRITVETAATEEAVRLLSSLIETTDPMIGAEQAMTAKTLLTEAVSQLADRPSIRPGQRIDLLLVIGTSLSNLGHQDLALPVLEMASDLAEHHLDPGHPASLQIMGRLAEAHLGVGNFGPAEELLRQRLDEGRQRLEQDPVLFATAAAQLADFYVGEKRLDEARVLMSEAQPVIEAHGSPLEQATVFAIIGQFHLMVGEYDRAASIFQRAAFLYQLADEERPFLVASCLAKAGIAHGWAGQVLSAQENLTKALQTWQERGFVNQPIVAQSLVTLASGDLLLGYPDSAHERLTQALDVYRASDRPKVRMGSVLSLIGSAALAMDDNDGSEASLTEAETLLCDEPMAPGPCIRNLALRAELARRRGDQTRVRDLLERAERIGNGDDAFAYPLSFVAEVRAQMALDQGEVDNALDWLRTTRTLRLSLVGEDHLRIALIDGRIGEILLKAGRLGEAEEILQRSHDHIHAAVPRDTPVARTAVTRLAALSQGVPDSHRQALRQPAWLPDR